MARRLRRAGAASGTVAPGRTYRLSGKQRRFNFSTVRLEAREGGWEIVFGSPAGEQRIPVGFAAWREGKVRLEAEAYEKLGGLVGEQATAASGAWTAPNVFRARIYFHGGTFRLDDTFTFKPDGTLELACDLFGMGGGKWTLNGAPVASAPFTLGIDKARPYEKGFVRDGDELVIDNGDDATRRAGAVWGLELRQAEARPFSVRTEALCEKGPGGGRTRDFSLYLDLTYADGDHLWGQAAEFAPDPKRGWRKGTVTIVPEKSVRVASVYCLYRGLPGRVRFRAPVVQTHDGSGLVTFDAIPQEMAGFPKQGPGFLVRDVAREGDVYAPIAVGRESKGLRLDVTETPGADGSAHFKVKVADTTGRDRAVTLVYALPLPAGELVYEQDPRTSVPLAATASQRTDAGGVGCGAGGLNRWPFGAVTVGGAGFGLGIDTARPAFFRTAVHPRARLLFIAFDLGLAPEKRTAEFAFRSFRFTGGFRGALARYAALEKSAFTTRVPEQGIWMPFASIQKVEGWEDFGFKFKEGNDEAAWDDAHGIFTFRYTEPTTWWLSMDRAHGTNAFTMADCLAKTEALAQKGNPWAVAWRETAMRDEDGERVGRVMDTPWCRGAIWILSPLPGIAGPNEYGVKNAEADFAKSYAKPFPEGQDGEYIDSAEGYLTPALDFNRAVFAASETPLVFSSNDDHRPGVFKGLAMYEYARRTAHRVWPRGRFVMANGVPWRWPWLPAYVDVGGTETQWIDKEGRWRPEAHASLIYKRAMSMGKPYCYLQNVDFEKFRYEDMENFMRHCVAYGLFPGCFSHNASEGHYFKRPEIYNRDRPLFRKYVPLCRTLSEAGWRPVNELVSTSDARVFAEQFGARYATVFNSAKEPLKVRLAAKAGARAAELVVGGALAFAGGSAEVEMRPDAVLVLDFGDAR
ncbi:MAG: hypothetical protein ACI4RA_00775 [Kiritimatiellia bacterium]